MKEYKLESLIYYSKPTLDFSHIHGRHLDSTNKTSFGAAVYLYLYFERDALT